MVNNTHTVADIPQTNPLKFFTTTSHTNIQSQIGSNPTAYDSSDNTFKICHQNIRGIWYKTSKIINSLLLELPK
jgi:hypothetical protein